MASSAILKIDVITETIKAVQGLNQVGDTATRQQSKFRRLGGVIAGALSIGAVVAFGKESVKAASEDQAAQAKLAQTLKNTTGATDKQVAASEDYITNLSKQTAVADDELRPAMATLVRATGDQEQAQKDLALATDIAAGTGKPLATVVDAMAKAAKGSTAPFAKLTNQSSKAGDAAKTMDDLMAGAAKTFDKQASVAAETTAGKMANAQNAMGEFSEEVGTALLPVVGQLADVLRQDLMPILSTIFQFIANNTSWLIPLAAGITAVVVATKIWRAAQAALNLTMKASTIGLIIAAIGLLVAAGIWLVQNWDKVVAWLKAMWQTIKRVAETVWKAISGVISKVWDTIKKAVTSAVEWVKDKISKVFKAIKTVVASIWNGIKAFFVGYWEALKTIFGTPIAWIKDKVGDVFKGIKTTIKTVWDAISSYFTTLWDDITAVFQTAWDYFEDFVEFLEGIGDILADVWDTVTESLEGAWNGIIDGLKTAVNFFIDGVNTIIGGINSVIDKVNRINPFGDIGHIPTIPRLAKGGVLTGPTLFLGGEAGREIVTPERLMRSIVRQEGGGRGGSYTLNLYPRTADVQDVAWGFRRLELLRGGR